MKHRLISSCLLLFLIDLSVQELKFPDGFAWSAATSSYQIEGGINGTGRGASIWEPYLRENVPVDNSTPFTTCDSYHRYKEDVKILKELGVTRYRFSIAWPRIFPTGTNETTNKEGVQYYHNLIDALLKSGIEPMVTIYHWDLPQALEDRGGWLNSQIVDWFGDYSRFCFEEYGSKVKHWLTINEPLVQTTLGYCKLTVEWVHIAPGGFAEECEWSAYLAGHHMLLAHGRAVHIYRNEFKAQQKGLIGITNLAIWYEPHACTPEDREAAKIAYDFGTGWFTHPLVSPERDYPESMRQRIDARSKLEGRTTSRLPTFTSEQKKTLDTDFIGINYYATRYASAELPADNKSPLARDKGIFATLKPVGKPIGNSWVGYYPEGLAQILRQIRNDYNNTPVFIVENGIYDIPAEGLNDDTRIHYIKGHLKAVHKAISEGSDIRQYTVWSLMDAFAFTGGYTQPFGLYHIDFKSGNLTREAKKSAAWYSRVIAKNAIVD